MSERLRGEKQEPLDQRWKLKVCLRSVTWELASFGSGVSKWTPIAFFFFRSKCRNRKFGNWKKDESGWGVLGLAADTKLGRCVIAFVEWWAILLLTKKKAYDTFGYHGRSDKTTSCRTQLKIFLKLTLALNNVMGKHHWTLETAYQNEGSVWDNWSANSDSQIT